MESNASWGHTDVPDASNLQRDAILQSMLEHISDYQVKDSLVDLQPLTTSVLRTVIDAPHPSKPEVNFSQEEQLRGFLQTFHKTTAYSSQFNILDDRTQAQIKAFKDKPESWKNEPIWRDTKRQGFRLPEVNPRVSEVLATSVVTQPSSGGLKEVLSRAFVKVSQPLALVFLNLKIWGATGSLAKKQAKVYAGGPIIYEEEDGKAAKPMDVYKELSFENWGKSVKNTPKYTFVPSTVLGIQNLVRYAKDKNLRVRCGGYRHSWSTCFSQDGEIFISFLPILQVTMLPDPISIYPTGHSARATELNQIELLERTPDVPLGKRWCRMGVAVTNEDFRRWAIENKGWSLPVDVILVEVTIGGVNGPICHGAGVKHPTISDYVRRIEYVDANANHQIISDSRYLKAAAGCFGLLGIVTHITLELDEMTYAVLKPLKVPVAEAIPPLRKNDVPSALRTDKFKDITDRDLEVWREDFARRAAEDYYSEWFWFTYQKRVWVNTWNNTSDPSNAIDYPGPEDTFFQWLQGWMGGIINDTRFFQALPGAWQAQLLATLGMAVLPPTDGEDQKPTYKTLLPDALHFRRGVQNMRVRDMEFQIPIPDLPLTDEPDWSIVQQAWWDAINLVYELADRPRSQNARQRFLGLFNRKGKKKCRTPMRLTLELRIMGSSSLHMAPQAGNKRTASIEVLTVPDADHDGEWEDFMQRLSDKWMNYSDHNNVRLNTRPHWAKEWETLKLGPSGCQVAAREYLRTVSYKKAIGDFQDTLREIGNRQGWTLEQIRGRFSNELWDSIVYS